MPEHVRTHPDYKKMQDLLAERDEELRNAYLDIANLNREFDSSQK